MFVREGWSNNAFFYDGVCRTVKVVVTRLHVVVGKVTRPIVTSSTEEYCVKSSFGDGYGMSLHDRSRFGVLGCQMVPDLNRDGFFIGNSDRGK